MRYQQLGASDLVVSVISMGVWQLGDPEYWGTDTQDPPDLVVKSAIDAGINLFDTAEWYGNGEAERVLGRVLGNQRDKVYIASKVSPEHCSAKELRKACENSLQRLQTDRIDLYQIHWPFRHVPFEEAYLEMERLQTEGKIRYIGVSNFGKNDLEEWFRCGACTSNQLGYNLLFRAIEFEIIPTCIQHNVGILVYMPLMQGLLTGRWNTVDEIPEKRRRTRHFSPTRSGVMHKESGCEELTLKTIQEIYKISDTAKIKMHHLALAWLLHQKGITSVIVGSRKVDQIKDNVIAADLTLDTDLLNKLDQITHELKITLGANADMWRSGAESRIR